MVNKIVFIDEVPLTQRYYERYGIPILLDAGFAVEIWDCMPFLVPGLIDFPVSDPLRFKGIRSFRTEREALTVIQNESRNTVFVIDIGYRSQSWQIFKALSRGNHVYGIQLLDAHPPGTDQIHHKLARWIPKLVKSPRQGVVAGFRKLPPRWLGIRSPDFVLRGGTASVDKRFPFGVPARQIIAHALDYDLFLKERAAVERDADVPQQAYAVFLDQFGPFHPDAIYLGKPAAVPAEDYYPELVRFFERVERDLGLQVVVAAHPRSYYERLPDYFGGRRVVRDKTVRLVKDAELVMTHASNALNFVVLYHHPILFLSYALHPAFDHSGVARIAAVFGKQPINLDDLPSTIDWPAELKVDEAVYKTYQERFIKQSGSPDKPAWQIFADFLKTLE
jgi:hypothetical protein